MMKKNAVNTIFKTHEVLNQSRSLMGYNMYLSDTALLRSMQHFGKSPNYDVLSNYGIKCGSEKIIETAILAEKNKPTLRQFDNFGRRIDVIDFHPAYHTLMKEGKEVGVANYGYCHEYEHGDSHIIRSALLYMQNQVDPGVCCPLVMTNAAIAVLKNVKGCEMYVQKLSVQSYDNRNIPIELKTSITAGMSMTEKQGGSDVRANTTQAIPCDPGKVGSGAEYLLTGHKVNYIYHLCTSILLQFTIYYYTLLYSGLLLLLCRIYSSH